MSRDILAVDDEEDIVRLVQFVLERAGYTVRTALSGVEALERVKEAIPALIICDIMMPHMDGLELVRRLKAEPSTEIIPVVMLTARSSDADVSEGWLQGADLYLTKPFSPFELLNFVNRLVPAEPAG